MVSLKVMTFVVYFFILFFWGFLYERTSCFNNTSVSVSVYLFIEICLFVCLFVCHTWMDSLFCLEICCCYCYCSCCCFYSWYCLMRWCVHVIMVLNCCWRLFIISLPFSYYKYSSKRCLPATFTSIVSYKKYSEYTHLDLRCLCLFETKCLFVYFLC